MAKWTVKEYEVVEWILKNVSELSIEEKHRRCLIELKKKPMSQTDFYNENERMAIAAAIEYFIDLYSSSIKGYPNGNRTVKQIKDRIDILKSAKQKLIK